MSGTSLDGLDLCLAQFNFFNAKWNFKILITETLSYSTEWKEKLLKTENSNGANLIKLHFEYGKFLGRSITEFLKTNNETADLIASHGHTIFHQVAKGFTFQLGHGAAISSESNITTVADFRSLDVALGGQGAPLVPFGDQELFSEYDCCVNLGGIVNISFVEGLERKAFDVCPINMVLNHYMRKEFNLEYDKNGAYSSKGKLNSKLFEKLNSLAFYSIIGPKSLGKEWVFSEVIPIIDNYTISLEDKLHTFTIHAAHQLANVLKSQNILSNILMSGGGTKNLFFLECLKNQGINYKVPSYKIIDFKEALIFGFLGLQSFLGKVNTLKSVTGASRDSIGGNCYYS